MSREQFKQRGKTALYCLLLAALGLLSFGCRMDMQDQPRYEYYEPSRFYADGQASRPLVEGTVPRGAQYRDANAYLYTGKTGGAQQQSGGNTTGSGAAATTGGNNGVGMLVDAGAQMGTATGGVGAGAANVQTGASGGGQATGDVNVRGNVAGGIPGASSATGGADVFPFPITAEVMARGEERFNIYCAMCHGMTGDGDGMIVKRGFRQPPSFHSEQLQPGMASASHIFDVISNGWGAMPSYADMIPSEDRWRIIAYVRALQLTRRGRVEDIPAAEQNRLRSNGQTPATGAGATGEQHGGTEH
ncbi:MAG TPA: cytochrome c [Pyrinomonadaceae bacterium]